MNVPTKKRPFLSEETSNDETTIKKAKFGEYFKGFFGSVIDVDKHVLQIQNRELYSKLMALKKQFELKTSTYEKNDNDKTKRISSLSNCLQELVSDINTLYKSTLADGVNNNDIENLKKTSILSFYFCCQEDSMDIENEESQPDDFLTKIKESLKEVFTKILANIHKQNEALLKSSEQQDVEKELLSEINKLKQHNAELLSNQKRYEKRINELETQLGEEKERVNNLNNEKDDLNEYIELQERNLQRQELKIQHLENEKSISITSEPKQNSENESKTAQKSETAPEPDDRDAKIEDLNNLLNMRLKEIESIRNEQKSMIENAFNIKKEVTEEDIAKSPLYHNILEKNNILNKDLQYERDRYAKLQQDYKKLEDTLNRVKQLMSQEFSKQCTYLQSSFDNATKKFKTIESERDKIKMKYEQLKAEYQSKNFNSEAYESLNKKFEERIKAKDNIINNLKNEIQNLKAELESKKSDLSNLSPEDAAAKEINSLKQTIESQNKQIDALSSEIDQIGQDYDELLIKYGKLEKDLQEREDYKSTFAGEKVKFSVIQSQMKKQKAILKEKNNTLDNKLSQQKRLLEEYIEKQKSFEEYRKTIEEENALLKKLSEESQAVAKESSMISDLLRRQYDEVNMKLLEANKEILELKTKSIDYENQFIRLREDINLKDKQLDRYRYKSKDKDDILFEMYRSRYNCTLCNKQRPIDSVIKTCYHIFCGQCIDERLIKKRNRKCPTCKEPFDKNDVHQLYFS